MKRLLPFLAAFTIASASALAAPDEAKLQASLDKVQKMWPGAFVPGNPLHDAILEERNRRATASPEFFNQPDWPELLVSMVAARLLIPPTNAANPQPAAPAPAPAPAPVYTPPAAPPTTASAQNPNNRPMGLTEMQEWQRQFPPTQVQGAANTTTHGLPAPVAGQEFPWFYPSSKVTLYFYDGTGDTADFSAGDVFPISRLMSWTELDAAQQKELPRAQAYFVIPQNGFCAMAPAVAGRWVNPNDPQLARTMEGWREFAAEQKGRIAEYEKSKAAGGGAPAAAGGGSGMAKNDRIRMLYVLRDERMISSIRQGETMSDETILRMYEQAMTQRRLRGIEDAVRSLPRR